MLASVGDSLVVVDPARGRVYYQPERGDSQILFTSDTPLPLDDAGIDRVRAGLQRFFPAGMSIAGPTGQVSRLTLEEGALDSVLELIVGDGVLRTRWDRVLVDADGRLWLRRASCFSSFGLRRWDVISLDTGRLVAVASVPENLAVKAVGGATMLVEQEDELGVAYLEIRPFSTSSYP
jgi:hypothetical protein